MKAFKILLAFLAPPFAILDRGFFNILIVSLLWIPAWPIATIISMILLLTGEDQKGYAGACTTEKR